MSMKTFNARVRVTLKRGVLDPQGKAIEGALASLEFEGVKQVRQGKTFDVILDAENKQAAEKSLTAMCEKLLANTVIEDYAVRID
jgi:phosphoribosylformylglycinamidine synthase PurS subunit